MPSSSTNGKREIHEWFGQHPEIKIVVDVGCGDGTYPKLLKDKKLKWIGVEIYEPYVEEFNLGELYETIVIGDIRNCNFPVVDCIIFGDVLEHLTKEEAKEVLKKVGKIYKHIVVSIPVNYPQEARGENPYEEHKSIWSFEELDNFFSGDYKIRKLINNIAIFIK